MGKRHKSKSSIENEMILVEGGIFFMGIKSGIIYADAKPVYQRDIHPFYIGKYPVTQAEWFSLMQQNPSTQKNSKLPVYHINWYEAILYCNYRSMQEGLEPVYNISDITKFKADKDVIYANHCNNGYRLPTEAEWEYAARGGNKSKGYKYSGSDNIDEVAWCNIEINGSPKPVGLKKVNELGLFDMSGNIHEWCWEQYTPGYNIPISKNEKDIYRVTRGGCYWSEKTTCLVTFRSKCLSHTFHSYTGLRVVRTAK